MNVTAWKQKLLGIFSRVTGDGSHRPDGGTSCYRPVHRKTGEPPLGEMEDSGSNQPVPYVHTGFTGMNPPVGGTMDSQPLYGQPAYSQPQAQPSAVMNSSAFAAQPSGPSNISYMPGYAPDAGPSYTHVEHIIALTGLRSCYEAIECMKNGETLIVTLDAIASESESMRCQDMLAGAAFTLGCHVRMLHGARLVLIVPEGVQILPEEQSSRAEAAPAAPAAFTPPAAPREGFTGRRERRTGTNPNWNAARSGEMNNYNPYTGSTPVAAGAYSNFGGYGY